MCHAARSMDKVALEFGPSGATAGGQVEHYGTAFNRLAEAVRMGKVALNVGDARLVGRGRGTACHDAHGQFPPAKFAHEVATDESRAADHDDLTERVHALPPGLPGEHRFGQQSA